MILGILNDQRGWSTIENINFQLVNSEYADLNVIFAEPTRTRLEGEEDLCVISNSLGIKVLLCFVSAKEMTIKKLIKFTFLNIVSELFFTLSMYKFDFSTFYRIFFVQHIKQIFHSVVKNVEG